MEAELIRFEPSGFPLVTTSWQGAPPQRGKTSVNVCGGPAVRMYCLGPNVGDVAAPDEANGAATNVASSMIRKYRARMVISLCDCDLKLLRQSHFDGQFVLRR